jgi:hypothetical protein
MPIVTHTLEQTTQPNGGTHNVVRLFDQDGREYMSSFFGPAGFDVQTKINIMISETDEQLKQSEFEALVGAG